MSDDIVFSPLKLKNISLKNRLIRSATYEGWGDAAGSPRPELGDLYARLGRGGVGTLITGFVFVSPEGRAMQRGQCGIDRDELVASWGGVVSHAKKAAPDMAVIMQLAHAGRQTREVVTGREVLGTSSRKCSYFKQKVRTMRDDEIERVIGNFADAAGRAQLAGFDGVQVHAAHGYLVHQFLSPWTNQRRDKWSDPALFLERIVQGVKAKCGGAYPVMVKISAGEDVDPGIRLDDVVRTIERVKSSGVDVWEISYGTMEYAMNIIRGDCPLDEAFEINPLFSGYPRWMRSLWKRFFARRYTERFTPFSEEYNRDAAVEIKNRTGEPVAVVGGFRDVKGIRDCLRETKLDAISLCRPLICEPNWPEKIQRGSSERSKCTQCNLCMIHCDGNEPLRCYRRGI